MGFDDEFDDEESQDIDEQEETDEFFDPLDITDPKDAYFFLSDDAQEEIEGDFKNMKCNSCGHKFKGDLWDDCPECFSPDTEEFIPSSKEDDDYSI